VIIFLCGLPVMRHLWFPWLYLFFAVQLPKGVHFRLTNRCGIRGDRVALILG